MNQQETEPIINRVAQSSLISLDLEDLYPEGERVLIDVKEVLFQGLVLREKDFRQWVKEHAWEQYKGKHVAITCTADAIVPVWAYMLIASVLEPHTNSFVFGSVEELENILFLKALEKIDGASYQDAKVVVKGCSPKPVPVSAYVEITRKLRPYAASIMYGEPCSTVPLYKRPRQ